MLAWAGRAQLGEGWAVAGCASRCLVLLAGPVQGGTSTAGSSIAVYQHLTSPPACPALAHSWCLQGTMLVALLQPSPETFELFDDVMLLASGMVSSLGPLLSFFQACRLAGLVTGLDSSVAPQGIQLVCQPAPWCAPAPCAALPRPLALVHPVQVLYHGPREGVMPFFRTHLGFDCPMRKGVADFLQEIALPSDQQARAGRGRVAGRRDGALLSACGVAAACVTSSTLQACKRRAPTHAPACHVPTARRLQKYWVDNTRAYRYVTAQTIRNTFWKVGQIPPAAWNSWPVFVALAVSSSALLPLACLCMCMCIPHALTVHNATRSTLLQSEASESQRLLLAAPHAADRSASEEDEKALTTEK